eukprot:3815872-Rhodomonas_salina.1
MCINQIGSAHCLLHHLSCHVGLSAVLSEVQGLVGPGAGLQVRLPRAWRGQTLMDAEHIASRK